MRLGKNVSGTNIKEKTSQEAKIEWHLALWNLDEQC